MRFVLLSVLAACSYHEPLVLDGATSDGRVDAAPDTPDGVLPWLHPWAHRKAITIHGNLIAGSLADFPVLIEAIDAQIGSAAEPDGADIRFTTADAVTLLDSEVESLDRNQLVAWVKLPQLAAGTDITVYVYYGRTGVSATDPTAVWTAGYHGVWHFAQPPGSGASGNVKDSTSNHLDGTSNQMTDNDRVLAKVGFGYAFDGSTKFVSYNTADLGDLFTISMWASFPIATSVKTLFANSPQGSQTNGVRFFINTNGNADRKLVLETGNGTNSATTTTGSNAIPVTTFTHVAAVVDRTGGSAKLYINGALVVTGSARQDFDTNNNFDVAQMEGSLFYPGQLDQVEVASGERPLEWVQTSFNNQDDPTAFATFGNEQNEP